MCNSDTVSKYIDFSTKEYDERLDLGNIDINKPTLLIVDD